MGKADVDSYAIRAFAKQVNEYVREQEDLISKLRGKYSAVNGQWNDLQYQKFGEALSDLEKMIKKTTPAFQDYAKKLEGKAKQIDAYLGK